MNSPEFQVPQPAEDLRERTAVAICHAETRHPMAQCDAELQARYRSYADAVLTELAPVLEAKDAEIARYKAAHESTQRALIRMEQQRDELRMAIARAAGGDPDTIGVDTDFGAMLAALSSRYAAVPPHDVVERAALWLLRAKTVRLEAEDAAYVRRIWEDVVDERSQNTWFRYAKDMLADLGCPAPVSESVPAELARSADEEVGDELQRLMWERMIAAAPEGHRAYKSAWGEQTIMRCGCGKRVGSGFAYRLHLRELAHDADPSRASATSEAPFQNTCGVCGNEGIQYQPFSGGKEYYCPSCEDVHPYEEGQAPRRAQMLHDGKFDELKQEMRDHLASLPKAPSEAGPNPQINNEINRVGSASTPPTVTSPKAASSAASTPPASGSAKRSGCCPCGYNRHNLSGCADCACTVMQKNHHHAPRPASGSSDTGPRKWKEGDDEPLCAYLNPDACYLVADSRGRLWLRRTENTGGGWDRLSTRFGKVGVADWRYLVATYGPLTEMFSSTEEEAPASRKGGDSHEW